MDFEWDDGKAAANERKHGVSFPEAATAFADPRGSAHAVEPYVAAARPGIAPGTNPTRFAGR